MPSLEISTQGHYIRLRNANKAEPTLALKPRGYVTRNPKQGYQWPKNGHVSAKNFFKKKRKKEISTPPC